MFIVEINFHCVSFCNFVPITNNFFYSFPNIQTLHRLYFQQKTKNSFKSCFWISYEIFVSDEINGNLIFNLFDLKAIILRNIFSAELDTLVPKVWVISYFFIYFSSLIQINIVENELRGNGVIWISNATNYFVCFCLYMVRNKVRIMTFENPNTWVSYLFSFKQPKL